jgi:hypothetical protein
MLGTGRKKGRGNAQGRQSNEVVLAATVQPR